MTTRTQRGFSLFELVIVLLILGTLTYFSAPAFKAVLTASDNEYRERQRVINAKVVQALSARAEQTANGLLPSPYTGGGYTSTVVAPTDTALTAELVAKGLSPVEANDDNSASRRVRVMQTVSGLTANLPMYSQAGNEVVVTYDYGVVYMTTCARATTSCNPSPSGVPGDSPTMTAANYTTWNVAGNDFAPVFISSLPIQKLKLKATTARIEKLRETLVSNFSTRQLMAPANDVTNHHPPPAAPAGTQNPATNMGCYDAWISLPTSTVPGSLGLSPDQFGRTAWGGAIWYCRDYDPTALNNTNANVAPHYAAIMFNRNVTQGTDPVIATPAENIVLAI